MTNEELDALVTAAEARLKKRQETEESPEQRAERLRAAYLKRTGRQMPADPRR